MVVEGEDGLIVGLAGGDEVVDDASELVGHGGDGLGGSLAVSHAAVEVAEDGLVTVEALSSHPERVGGWTDDFAGSGREDLSASDTVVGTEAEPTGEIPSGREGGEVRTALGEEGLDGVNFDAGDRCEVDPQDAVVNPSGFAGGSTV